jgi:hypothetical protein
MTAKEKLRARVETLTEQAAETLRLLDLRVGDPVLAAFRDVPLDEEPLTDDETAAIAEADADLVAGRVLTHEEILRKHG